MAANENPASRGGSFDVIYEFGDAPKRMGFILAGNSRERRVNDFAPSIRVGGDPAYSEGVFQQLVLDSMHQGGDKKRLESGELRYQYSDAGVALHREEEAQLSSQWASSDAGWTATYHRILDFSDNNATFSWTLVAATAGGVDALRAYNGSVWGSAGPSGDFGVTVKNFIATDKYAFVALGSANNAQRWDGAALTSTWSDVGGGTPVKADGFVWYNDTLYRWLGDTFYNATNNDGSTWNATGVDVGWESTDISDMYVVAGYLIIAKPEGLWLYDGTNLVQMINAETLRNNNNFKGGSEFKGEAYLPFFNTVRKSVIAGLRDYTFTDVTPRMKGDTNKVDYGHGFPVVMFGGPGDWVFAAFDDGESVYPEVLMTSGIGWHQIYRGTSGDTMKAAGYSRINGWLMVNDGATRRKRLRSLSDAEFPDYNSSGLFTTPKIDGGFPDMYKAFRDITLEVRGCDSNNTILVEYSLDEGAWTTVGTINTSTPPRQTLTFGGLDQVVVGKELELRFTLTRNSGDVTETPVIEFPIVVRLLTVPNAQHAFSDVIVVDEKASLRNKTGKVGDAYTTNGMLQFIDELEDTAEVIIRTDRFGRRWRVKNTDFARDDADLDPLRYERESPTISLTFIEVESGLKFQSLEDDLTLSESSFTGTLNADDDADSLVGTMRVGLSIVHR